ncbi:MAG: SUMF1/EgtB/PvdO family nonheme iron enzyme [Chloroflexi bacterium]|nr:SUMF1/EgtB/PvdO family nonheme iron enzyme [Chloroflexota bacterium]
MLEWPNTNPALSEELIPRMITLIGEQFAYPVVSPRLRANVGSILTILGDPRQEVIDREPAVMPVVDFGFEIAKYPVTNAQYWYFVDDGGYTTKWDRVWSEEGWKWRDKKQWQQPRYWDDVRFNQPNQPVVGVSWYEAEAYASWLSEVTSKSYRLPTEEEWEKAARDPNGGNYPWGDWEEGYANTREAGIDRPSAVGLFPKGVAHCGAHDMAGNVWEWTNSWYDEDKEFAVCGGSWYDELNGSHVLNSSWSSPHDWDNYLGVRLVRVPHFSGS